MTPTPAQKIVVTGAGGLLGWHASVRIHAQNCAALFSDKPQPYELVRLSHADFDDTAKLDAAVTNAHAVLHFAGVNRGDDTVVEASNPDIATRLIDACQRAGNDPHIVYANSTHAKTDTPYGRSKRIAGERLDAFATNFTNLILPHIFGEAARPFYNNVTATLIHQILSGDTVTVNPDGQVHLLHAGAAVQVALDAVLNGTTGNITPQAHTMSVPDLLQKLQGFHEQYTANVYPDLSGEFDLALFNSYRAAGYPENWPRPLVLHKDARGTLFEAVKGGGGGQSFLSTTKPGITRGDHFHLDKVERFLVVQGKAVIRIRKVFCENVMEYSVSGDTPCAVDMPTLHTHSIENVGSEPLLTLFWTHELFDPKNPDTFADKVLP
jgi:UDP-2-acetamido-2,6-beta-L-arabino-hexul-4-ose reductase